MIRKLALVSLSLMIFFFLSNEGNAMELQQIPPLVIGIPVVKNVGNATKRDNVRKALGTCKMLGNKASCALCEEKGHDALNCPDFDNEDFDLEKSSTTLPTVLNSIYNGINELSSFMHCQEVADLTNGIESLLHRVSDSNKMKGYIRTSLIKKFEGAKIWERDFANKQAAAVEKRLLNDHMSVVSKSSDKKEEEAQDEENQISRYKDKNEYRDRQAEDSSFKLTSSEAEKAATAKKLRNDYNVWVQKATEFPALILYAK